MPEKVRFENRRGKTLVGNYWEADSDSCIVMSHGVSGDKSEHGFFDTVAERLNEAGYEVLAFDFVGAGESDFELFTVEKEVEDLSAALGYCRDRGVKKFGLFGYSLGGLVSLRNCGQDIEALALVAPVTDSFEMLEGNLFLRVFSVLGFVPFIRSESRRIMLARRDIIREMRSIDQEELLEDVDSPTLIVHGEQDGIIPLENSKRATEKLENSRLEVLEDSGHVISDENAEKNRKPGRRMVQTTLPTLDPKAAGTPQGAERGFT